MLIYLNNILKRNILIVDDTLAHKWESPLSVPEVSAHLVPASTLRVYEVRQQMADKTEVGSTSGLPELQEPILESKSC